MNLKNLSIKKFAPATLLTVLTLTPSLSPLAIETKKVSPTDSRFVGAATSTMTTREQTKSSEQALLFQLTDWDYEEVGNQLILTQYKGNSTTLYLPAIYEGRQLVLPDFSIFPKTMTHLQIESIEGQKVALQTTSLEDAFVPYPYLISLDLNGLDISKVTSLQGTFRSLKSLQNLEIETWDTSQVRDMSYLFCDTHSLTSLAIEHWDTSAVENMSWMFGMTALSQLNLNQWDISQVQDLSAMFYGASHLTNLEISKWDTSAVRDMSHLFQATTRLKTIQVKDWETSNVQSMAYLFAHSGVETLDIGSWDVSNVETLQGAFSNLSALTTLNLNQWQTTHLKNLTETFRDSTALTQLFIDQWEVSQVTTMDGLFKGMTSLTQLELGNWKTTALTSLKDTFRGMSQLQTLDVSGWDTSKVTNLNYTFEGVRQLSQLDLSSWRTPQAQSMQGLFKGMSALTQLEISQFDTSNVTNLSSMFYGVSQLTSLDLSQWETTNVTDMSYLFYDMKSLVELHIEHFQVYRVTTMRSMFQGVSKLESLNLNQWITTNVNDLSYTFAGMNALKDLKVSNWRTSRVTTMQGLFQGLENLTTLNLKGWDTSKVTNMSYMFQGMHRLNMLELKHFKTSNVITMHSMFYGVSQVETLDLSGWDTSSLMSTPYLFYGMEALRLLDLSGWDLSQVVADYGMFGLSHVTPLTIITTDTRLKQYDYQSDQRIGVENRFDASGGLFKDQTPLLIVRHPIVFEQKDSHTTQQAIQNLLETVERPTRDQCQFGGWQSQSVETSSEFIDSLKGSYTATWQCHFPTLTIQTTPTVTTTILDGTGEPGANVRAFVNGQPISTLTEVNSKGNYQLVIPKQKTGTIIQIKMTKSEYQPLVKEVTVLNEFKTFTHSTPTVSSTTITGKGTSGATVKAYVGSKQIGKTVKVDAKGNYKLTIPKQKAGTTITFKIEKSGYQTLSKNINVLNEFKTFTYSNPTPTSTTITGKGEIGATIKAYVGNKQIGKIVKVDSKGNYKLTIPKQKVNTTITLKIEKSGYQSLSKDVKVLYSLKTFTVSTPTISSTTITGKGTSGATVKAYVGNKQIGKTVKVDAKGNYKLTIPKQKAGTTITLKIEKSGYQTVSKKVNVLNEFKTFTHSTPTISSTTITGKGTSGATVKAYVGNKQIGKTVKVDAKGNYKLTIPKQKAGTTITLKIEKSGYQTVSKKVNVLNEFKTLTVSKTTVKSTTLTGKGTSGAK